jgi:orotidine-5'-phosphate decarboxylase
MNFMNALRGRWRQANTLLCVGLDPDPERLPRAHLSRTEPLFDFCKTIVDATADYVCAFKPQIAHFAAQGAESVLEEIIDYIHNAHPAVPVILDAKRGDIGSTAEFYAQEAFVRYRADAVTVNPFLGHDSVEPYTRYSDKGVIILCRTSNPGGSDLQFLEVNGKPLYQHIAQLVATQWNQHQNCGLVVGATFPNELAQVRALVGDMPLLVPGVGAQGGDVKATVQAGRDAQGAGMIINSSRAILFASSGEDFAEAARQVAQQTRDSINVFR